MAELVWEGKHREILGAQPPVVPLPIGTVERIAAPGGAAADSKGWANRLIWGSKSHVLPALRPEFAGKVQLIYIDPPFSTGSTFSLAAGRPRGASELSDAVAYHDVWQRGLDSYLAWFWETVTLLRPLLAPEGSLYVHLDWHVGAYAKAILDELCGQENFLGEIVWNYGSPSGGRAAGAKLVKAHDILYGYAQRRGQHKFRPVYLPYADRYVRDWFKWTDGSGRRYRKRMRGREADGSPKWEMQYLDQSKGVPASTVWNDIQQIYADPRAYKQNTTSEIVGYPTQKPEKLLERLIKLTTDEGDLVLDCFVGSGSSAVVAERLGRRWIACDVGRFAVQVTRKRLLGAPHAKPFILQTLGAPERAAWLADAFGHMEPNGREAALQRFILQRFGATPLANGQGVKAGRRVLVAKTSERPNDRDIAKLEQAPDQPDGVDLLGWDFDLAAPLPRGVRLLHIPRELLGTRLEDCRIAEADFLELPAVSIGAEISGRQVRLELVGADTALEAIDSWSIDWNYQGDVLATDWHSFRTRKHPELMLEARHGYARAGLYSLGVLLTDLHGSSCIKVASIRVG